MSSFNTDQSTTTNATGAQTGTNAQPTGKQVRIKLEDEQGGAFAIKEEEEEEDPNEGKKKKTPTKMKEPGAAPKCENEACGGNHHINECPNLPAETRQALKNNAKKAKRVARRQAQKLKKEENQRKAHREARAQASREGALRVGPKGRDGLPVFKLKSGVSKDSIDVQMLVSWYKDWKSNRISGSAKEKFMEMKARLCDN